MELNSFEKELLTKVRRIEIATRRSVKGVLSGQYHSRFKGHGMQFSEYREYAAGDDVRYIDWKVTARTDRAHIKLFEEERELTVLIAIDISASMNYSSENKLKKETIIEAAALIAFSAIRNGDRVGLLLFSDKVEKYVPPKKGTSHAMRIIRDIIYTKSSSHGTNVNDALKFLSNLAIHNGIIFVASDFVDGDFSTSLKILNNKHDLIAIRAYDKNEVIFPKVGLLYLKDAETGEEKLINTNSYSFKKEHHDAVKSQIEKTKLILSQSKIDSIHISTHEESIFEIMKYFKRRKKYA